MAESAVSGRVCVHVLVNAYVIFFRFGSLFWTKL